MKWKLPWPTGFSPNSAFKYCSGVVLILTIVMASISRYNHHPDESNHLSAATYYINHFLPPAIGDPEVRDTYSVWGISYLNYHWVEYFLAGKFVFLISPLISDGDLAARFFNVSLFAILAAFFLYRSRNDKEEFTIPCFLLVTPQIWYVFSYFNNDAFALFISVLLAYEISYQDSLLNEFLRSEPLSAKVGGGILSGILFGLQIICKPNYWVFVLFAAAWVLIRGRPNWRALQKYSVIGVIALTVFAFRVGLDLYVNGETNLFGASYINYFLGGYKTSGGKLLAYQNEIAGYEFKPSTLENDLAQSRPEVELKAKGTTAAEMFTKWQWHKLSFNSLVGVYGYMSLLARSWYYTAMLILFSTFFIYLWLRIVASKDSRAILELATVTVGSLLCIFISFYLSWNYAFQPQGRYLFPIIPMFAVFVYTNRHMLDSVLVNGFLSATFALSAYSFVFVGLAKIDLK